MKKSLSFLSFSVSESENIQPLIDNASVNIAGLAAPCVRPAIEKLEVRGLPELKLRCIIS